MVKVSVGSWDHLIEHDGIQENEAASNQERLNSELLAASEDTSKLRHWLMDFPSHRAAWGCEPAGGVRPKISMMGCVRCTCLFMKTRLCETAAAGGCHRGTPDGPYVRSHGLHQFRGHSPHPLQPYLEARTLIYDNELFPWRFPHAQATIVCCSCGVFRCVNVSPSTPLRGSLDLLQAARAPLRSRLQQEVQRVVV